MVGLGLSLSIAPRPIDPNCYFFFFLPPPKPKPLPLPFPWLPAYEWGEEPPIELTQPIVASDRMEAAFFIARRPTIFSKSVRESDVRIQQVKTLFIPTSGNTDINNGNLKLILGLIWSLIAHYQLGASNFPPKKLMLAWLKVRMTIFIFRCMGNGAESYFFFPPIISTKRKISIVRGKGGRVGELTSLFALRNGLFPSLWQFLPPLPYPSLRFLFFLRECCRHTSKQPDRKKKGKGIVHLSCGSLLSLSPPPRAASPHH